MLLLPSRARPFLQREACVKISDSVHLKPLGRSAGNESGRGTNSTVGRGAPQFLESGSVPSDSPSTLPGPQGSGKPVLIPSTLRCSLALNEESCLYLSNNSVQTPLALNQRAYRKTGGPRHAHKSPAKKEACSVMQRSTQHGHRGQGDVKGPAGLDVTPHCQVHDSDAQQCNSCISHLYIHSPKGTWEQNCISNGDILLS